MIMSSFARNTVRQNLILVNAVWFFVAPLYAVSNSLTITESAGVTTNNYPVQVGRPFVQGEVPSGGLPQASVNGVLVPTQVDVKSRWGDGSLKHAIISFLIPTLSANRSVSVTFGPGTTVGNAALSQAQMLGGGYNFDATIALIRSGSTKTASARTMLQNNDYTLWTSGPIVTTVLLGNDAQTTTCGGKAASTYDLGFDSFCSFRPRFEAQFWAGTNQVRVRFVGEITNTEQMEDVVVDNVVLTTGSTSPTTAYTLPSAKSPLTMFAASRWTKIFWLNGQPPAVGINHNLAYLASSTALPNYDTTKSVDAGTLSTAYSNWLALPRDLYDSGEWNSNGSCCNITSGGGHDWLGPVSSWTGRWLYSGDSRIQAEALGNVDLAGSFPIHFREGASGKFLDRAGTIAGIGRVMSISSRPRLSWVGSGNGFIGGPSNNGSAVSTVGPVSSGGWVQDPAHEPNFFPEYLLTGDHYYLDENMFWAGWTTWFGHNDGTQTSDNTWASRGPTGVEGGIPDRADQIYQLRGEGWAFRGRAETAWAIPDAMPEKNYFTQLLNDAIAYWEGERNITTTAYNGTTVWTYGYNVSFKAANPTDNFWTSVDLNGPDYYVGIPPLHWWELGNVQLCDNTVNDLTVSHSCISPWMQDYLVYSLGRARELGYATDALLNWVGPNIINQVTDPTFNPYLLTAYRVGTVKQSGPSLFTSWADVKTGFLPAVQSETDFYPGAVYQGTQSDADGNVQPAAAVVALLANQTNGTAAWNWMATNVEPAIFGDLKWAILPRTAVTPPPSGTTPPTITTSSPLPTGTIGTAYSQSFAAVSGTPPYTWSVSAGSLPAGLSLSAGGTLSGTPTNAGTANFTIQVQDSASRTGSNAFSLTVLGTGTSSAGACDLNNDGVVNTADVQLAISQALGSAPCTAAVLLQTGLTCDVVDVQRVINAALGGACLIGNSSTTTGGTMVSLTLPLTGSTLSGVVSISASATGNVAIASVQFKLDGSNLGGLVTGHGPSYSTSWNTTTAVDGTHILTALATDMSGNTALSAGVSVIVKNGTTGTSGPPLTVSLTSPLTGSTLSGVVTISANATDNVAIASVQFKLDGNNLGGLVTGSGPSYSTSWNTTTVVDGGHILTAFATDPSGNTALSTGVSITVQNGTGGNTGGSGPFSVGWTSLTNTKLQGVCPPDSGGYPFSFDCQYVLSAWSGGIADTKRNRLIIWGGGHNDYYGNEIYSLNLNSNPVTLTRLNNPSPINSNTAQCPTTLSDGNPNSRHTYDGLTYLSSVDKMLAFGGGVACAAGDHLEDLWTLDLSSLSWQRMDPVNGASGQQPKDFSTPVPAIAVYDPNSQLTLISDTSRLWSYNVSTNTYQYLNGNAIVPYESTAVVDPKRKLIYFIGTTGSSNSGYVPGTAATFYAMDISSGSNYAVQNWTSLVTGCDGLAQAEWPGVAYDSALDRVVGWPNFGNTVYIFNPDNKSCTTQTFPNGPPNSTDYNGVAYSTGTFGRFEYFPGLDVFALVNFWTNNAYVLKLN
jgi:hypothetical protein